VRLPRKRRKVEHALFLSVAVRTVEVILCRAVGAINHAIGHAAGHSVVLRMLLAAASLADYRGRVVALRGALPGSVSSLRNAGLCGYVGVGP
jgi:hypothetical protein